MKPNRWMITLLIRIGLLVFVISPATATTITFDDLTDTVVVTGLGGVVLNVAETSKLSIILTDQLTAPAAVSTSRFFALQELELSDGPAGGISDIIRFSTTQGSSDYEIGFVSDGEGALTGGPFYGTRGESEAFLVIPLPTDAPVPPDLIVRARSDAPIVPEPSILVLLCGGIALLSLVAYRRAQPSGRRSIHWRASGSH
jgi:hypothetical protein